VSVHTQVDTVVCFKRLLQTAGRVLENGWPFKRLAVCFKRLIVCFKRLVVYFKRLVVCLKRLVVYLSSHCNMTRCGSSNYLILLKKKKKFKRLACASNVWCACVCVPQIDWPCASNDWRVPQTAGRVLQTAGCVVCVVDCVCTCVCEFSFSQVSLRHHLRE
jgi:hypothetical protein